jgi:hypothetical protein
MVRKAFLAVMLFAFVSLASGCVSVYTDGCCGKQPAPKKTVKLMDKEPGILEKADSWVEKNLW